MNPLQEIGEQLRAELAARLGSSGIMHRLFMRVKTPQSIGRKLSHKGDNYRPDGKKLQDAIGLRVVLYFPEDVEILSFFLSCRGVVKEVVDEPDATTFRPQRLNLTHRLPGPLREAFRRALPPDVAPLIDDTYEIQIRTIFSEGWHEVEHDLRYKCRADWAGCDSYSRKLNGLFATLETAEWAMQSLFSEMAQKNRADGNYAAMLRNRMRIRLQSEDFSPAVAQHLEANPAVADALMQADRMVLLLTLLNHRAALRLDHDHLLFLVNRIELQDPAVSALESEAVRRELDAFFRD